MTPLRPTLIDLIDRAVLKSDAKAAGRFVDILRAVGWRYDDIMAEVVRRHPTIEPAHWDELLEQADYLESQS